MDSQHIFLIDGIDYIDCKKKVEHFLRQNLLVRYPTLYFDDQQRLCASNKKPFWDTVDWGQQHNRLTIKGFIAELEDLGFESLHDLGEMMQGYESKILHTITHLLDGFFGMDSLFYNLIEDSHWVSQRLSEKINTGIPDQYFLVFVQGSFQSLEQTDQVPLMRRLGVS